MVGVVRGVTVDGKFYVDVEDYQQLVKKYEDAVGFEDNKQIIARVGEDEIPDEEPDGCKGCIYEKEPALVNPCNICANAYRNHWKSRKK